MTGAALYNNAIGLVEEGNISGAADCLLEALSLEGPNGLYMNVLGLCMYARGEFSEAKAYWSAAAANKDIGETAAGYVKELFSDNFRKYAAAFNSCLDCISRGQPANAAAVLFPVLEKVPNVAGYNVAGLLACRLGFRNTALKFWKKALDIDLSDKAAIHYVLEYRKSIIPLFIENILLVVLKIVKRSKLL